MKKEKALRRSESGSDVDDLCDDRRKAKGCVSVAFAFEELAHEFDPVQTHSVQHHLQYIHAEEHSRRG